MLNHHLRYYCYYTHRRLSRKFSIRKKAGFPITLLANQAYKMMMCSSSSSNNNNYNNDNNQDNNYNSSITDTQYLKIDEEKKMKDRLTIEDIRFSTGYSREQGLKDIRELLRDVEGGAGGGMWTIAPDAMGVERTFKFKGFKNAWAFMNTIASESVQKKHHPEWSNIYNTVFIRWTTHSPAGLSEKDVMSARICDEHAKVHGEITAENNDGKYLGADQKLVNKIVDIARECCIPKKFSAT